MYEIQNQYASVCKQHAYHINLHIYNIFEPSHSAFYKSFEICYAHGILDLIIVIS